MVVRIRGQQQEADGQDHHGRCQASVSVPAFVSLVFCHLLHPRIGRFIRLLAMPLRGMIAGNSYQGAVTSVKTKLIFYWETEQPGSQEGQPSRTYPLDLNQAASIPITDDRFRTELAVRRFLDGRHRRLRHY